MARLSFGRTVVKSICEVMYYDENNDKQRETVELFGDYDFDTASAGVEKALGTKRFIIEDMHHKSFYGRITFEKFAEVCEKSNEKEW